VQRLVSKIKVIVTHFRKSYTANEKLLTFQRQNSLNETPLKLINDVQTRWNSTYYILGAPKFAEQLNEAMSIHVRK
jgi:hypothetical protein